ncbi:MAG: hypothetical protein J0I28_10925 [Caulobacterales bacterium]|nr:hypothetical protein [Caulobacterales bacterium]
MKIRPIATLAAMALAAGLAACATPTPYQPAVRGTAVSGGFSDARITENRFRVTFSGNTLTSRETVERYLLFRAAELTTQTGYDWFEIVDRATDRDRRTYSTPGMMGPGFGGWGYGYWQPAWRFYGPRYGWRSWDPFWGGPFGGPWGGGFGGGFDTRTVEKFEASAEIMLRRGPTPEDNPRAFDARQVMSNLGPNIQRPQPRS